MWMWLCWTLLNLWNHYITLADYQLLVCIMGKFHNQDGPDSSDTLLRQGGSLDPFLLGPRMLKLCVLLSVHFI